MHGEGLHMYGCLWQGFWRPVGEGLCSRGGARTQAGPGRLQASQAEGLHGGRGHPGAEAAQSHGPREPGGAMQAR
eukprot:scaffold377691_cov39-Prasinocladus_malaysianus.AAC.2